MPFTFDSPITTASAYKKTHRRKSASSPLLSPKSRNSSTAGSTSTSLFSKLTHRIGNLTRGSGSPSSTIDSNVQSSTPTPASDSLFFLLPLPTRQKIYGYVIRRQEVLHILLKHKPSAQAHGCSIAYRRCRAHGHIDDCVASTCREFLDIADGAYFGSFDHAGGLLLTCRDIYKEASAVLYSQNTFDFDHPLSLDIFSSQISPSALQGIRSISFEPQRHLYARHEVDSVAVASKSLLLDQWSKMWDIIATMRGTKEVRVRFRSRLRGWNEREMLDPLFKVTRQLNVFDVEAPWMAADMGIETPFRLIKSD